MPRDEGTVIAVSAQGKEAHIVLMVHNEGVPISESARQRIFDPFVRGERRGERRPSDGSLGLGLYIAREIATAHGGSVDVESGAAGTTFTAWLPRQ